MARGNNPERMRMKIERHPHDPVPVTPVGTDTERSVSRIAMPRKTRAMHVKIRELHESSFRIHDRTHGLEQTFMKNHRPEFPILADAVSHRPALLISLFLDA